MSSMATAREHGAELALISDDSQLLAGARIPLALPAGVPEWLSPLIAIVPGQLFAMRLAHTRGYDPDRPRALRKVTETHYSAPQDEPVSTSMTGQRGGQDHVEDSSWTIAGLNWPIHW